MNNTKLKISVVVPVRNGDKTLERCLVSVLNQNFFDYEIIIVDNGSTDKTKEIIDQFLKKSAKLVYVFEPKPGRANARNAGMAVASGEIIAMIDADCLAPSDWLEKITAPIINDRELVVAGFEKDIINNYWSSRRQEADRRFMNAKTNNGYINHLDTKNFAIKTDLLKRFRFNPALLAGEDWDLYLRLRKENIKIKFLPEVLVGHCHESSFSELFASQLIRGKYLRLILNIYRYDPSFKEILKNDESARSLKIMNFILFIPWAIWQFLVRPLEAPYSVTADLAWKCGIIFAKFK